MFSVRVYGENQKNFKSDMFFEGRSYERFVTLDEAMLYVTTLDCHGLFERNYADGLEEVRKNFAVIVVVKDIETNEKREIIYDLHNYEAETKLMESSDNTNLDEVEPGVFEDLILGTGIVQYDVYHWYMFPTVNRAKVAARLMRAEGGEEFVKTLDPFAWNW